MKGKNIVRAIDDVGRITLPKYFRDSLEMNNGDSVEIKLDKDCIIIKKSETEEKSSNED